MIFKFRELDKAWRGKHTIQFPIPASIKESDRITEVAQFLYNSILFDADWYRRTYPEIMGRPDDLARHYVEYGVAEGRDPHPLFSTSFYLDENPDVAASGLNPLIHYIKHGGQERRNPHPLFDATFYLRQRRRNARSKINPLECYLQFEWKRGLNPNPFFDTNWYVAQNPSVLGLGLNPLVHYVTIGEGSGANPSSRFEVDWYLRCNIDVDRAGVSPLRHYLQSGWKENRLPSRSSGLVGAATDAAINCLKTPSLAGEVALFVTHSPDGHLKPHVHHYLDSLQRHGIAPILIVATDQPFQDGDQDFLKDLCGIFVRQNEGFDFAAWAHVWRLYPQLYEANLLYLLNDSVVGPVNDDMFGQVVKRIRESPADFIGLTDSHESMWHLQSFFLAFKRGALASAALRKFVDNVVSFSQKTGVIAEYELRFASTLMSAHLSCDVLFPQETPQPINRTLFHWKALLNSGFPFVKVSTLRDGHPEAETSDWRAVLGALGYDIAIAECTITGTEPTSSSTDPVPVLRVQPPSEGRAVTVPPQPEFDAEFYRTIYPDIAAAGVDPHDHYVKHGQSEGRLARPPEQLNALADFRFMDSAKETVLIVSHEGVRGGAPILAYNIMKVLGKKYNVIALFLGDGPMLKESRDIGALVVGPIGLAGSSQLAELVVKRICETSAIKFAIVNTIASRYVLRGLAREFVPTVSLIHEFAAYIRPRNAFREAALWSGEVVFSSEITRDAAICEYPDLGGSAYPIIPQGRCDLPKATNGKGMLEDAERPRVLCLLRPKEFPAKGVVIIGLGLVEFRKGVDLFIECAARVLKSAPDLPVRFAWVGRGYDPEADVAYSVYLADQVRRHGIETHFTFLNEVSDLAAVYESADLLVLSSRLDPLPNVAIDALTVGLPVVCFAKTTGIADILTKHGLGEQTVAPYLDTDELARRVVALARSKELRTQVGRQSSRLAETIFDLDNYVAQLEQLGARETMRCDQERADVAVIVKSNLPRLEYYLSPGQPPRPREEVIREYVRSWATGISRRKLFPGFHPGIYREKHGLANDYADPLADYIRAGQPEGPWTSAVIGPGDTMYGIAPSVRIALHIHAYHLNVIPEILERLSQNKVRPDLLISVKSAEAQQRMQELVSSYRGGQVEIRLVPDPGRDVGPFLTEFGRLILNRYDLVGHLHTKTSADLKDSSVAKTWVRFLLENVLGGTHNPMADISLGWLAKDPTIGIVYPDDPHPVGWDDNERFVTQYCADFGLTAYPKNLHVPVGAMFWARSEALRPMIDLGLDWSDYPVEPLPYDGSLLHGLERLYGLAVDHAGFKILNTYVPGVTR